MLTAKYFQPPSNSSGLFIEFVEFIVFVELLSAKSVPFLNRSLFHQPNEPKKPNKLNEHCFPPTLVSPLDPRTLTLPPCLPETDILDPKKNRSSFKGKESLDDGRIAIQFLVGPVEPIL